MQLAIGISAAQGSVQLKVNEAVAVESSGPLDTLAQLGYRGFSAGIIFTDPAQPPIDVYVDELIAGTTPIPCDPVTTGGPVTR